MVALSHRSEVPIRKAIAERRRRANRCVIALLALIAADATSACGSGREEGITTGSGGSGNQGASGSGGTAGTSGSGGTGASPADASNDGWSTDANGWDSATDGLLPPNRDAADNPNCRLPATPPATCYVAGTAPPVSPMVQCLRSPREFVNPTDYAGSMRMRADTLYWTTQSNGAGIWQKKGPANPEMLLALPNIWQLEIDDVAIYFNITTGDAGQISLMRVNLDKSGLITLIPDLGVGAFAIDQDRIYFDRSDGQLVAASKSSGDIIEMVQGPASVTQMVGPIDATHLYWNEGDAPDVALKRVLKGSSDVETLAMHLPGAAKMLQGDGVLLVAENRYILEVPKVGGCPKLLVATRGFNNMTADDGAIYWRSTYSSDLAFVMLYRAPRSGGVTVELSTDADGGRGGGSMLLTRTQVIFTAEVAYTSKPTIRMADRF